MYSIYLEDGIEVVLVLFTAFSRGSHKRLTATSDGGMCHWMQPRQHLQTLAKVLELGQLVNFKDTAHHIQDTAQLRLCIADICTTMACLLSLILANCSLSAMARYDRSHCDHKDVQSVKRLTGILPLLLNCEARIKVSSLTEAGTPRMVG